MDEEDKNKEIEDFMKFLTKMFGMNINNIPVNTPLDGVPGFGISFTMGPDGKPEINTFTPNDTKSEEPMVDLFTYEDRIEAIFETPGITNKDQIEIKLKDTMLEFEAINGDLHYSRIIDLKHLVHEELLIIVKNRTTLIFAEYK